MTAAAGREVTPAWMRDLAAQAEALGAAITAAHDEFRARDGEDPVCRAGFRLDDAAGQARAIAAELQATAADLARIAARPQGSCTIPWGVCPEHGNTLTGTGGNTWCRAAGCRRTWGHDRLGMPCAEPARWTVTDLEGGQGLLCDGHALDARKRLEGARVVPLGAGPEGTCTMAPVPAFPYPHQRNDCEMCRERDADVHVLGEAYNRPGKRPLLVCQHCLGPHAALRAISESGPGLDRPVTVTITVAPGRRQSRVPGSGR